MLETASSTLSFLLRSSALSALGVGILLAWLVLPLFAALARQSKGASPESYHRALVLALLLGTGLFATPFLHGLVRGALSRWFGASPELALDSVLGLDSVGVVSAWVVPLIGPSDSAWPSSPLALTFSGLGLLWLVAVGIGVGRLLLAQRALARLCRRAVGVPADVRQRVVGIAEALGVAPPLVLATTEVALPFTAGVLRSVVLLPATALGGSEPELDFMLQHELTHVVRGDTRIALGVRLAGVAFTLHPTARRLAAEIAFAREASVDARVAAKAPLEYARFLLVAAEHMRPAAAARLVAVSMADTALSRRIDMLINPAPHKRGARRTFISLGSAAVAVMALIGVAPASWGIAGAAPDKRGGSVNVSGTAQAAVGQLPKEVINRVVQGYFPAFRACYERLPTPRYETSIGMHFVIGKNGRIRLGHVDAAGNDLGGCAEPIMMSMVFPAPEAGEVTVSYPIAFAPGAGEPVADGPEVVNPARLPPDVIRKVVRDAYPELARCYESLKNPRPKLRLEMHFTIGRTGRISEGHVDAEQHPSLGRCVEQVMLRLVFPPPSGGVVTVKYPVELAP